MQANCGVFYYRKTIEKMVENSNNRQKTLDYIVTIYCMIKCRQIGGGNMKLGFGTKLSYGIGGVADNAMYTISGTFLLFFLTTVAGIQPAAAGTIAAIGSVWEAFCGPICGYFSDNIDTRFGKRKPFLIAAAIPVAVITSLLFTAIDATYTFKIFYYGLMTILFWTSFASFFVPYMAWGSDLTADYNERTVLRSYAYVFNQVGMAIGMVLPTIIVDFLMNMGKSTAQSWTAVGIFCGVCAGAALLICAFTIKKSDVPNFKKSPNKAKIFTFSKIIEMYKGYIQILKLKPIRFLLGASVLYLIANTIFSSDRIYYFSYNLGLSATNISFIMFLITVVGICLVPLVAGLSNKTDKKLVFMLGIGITGIIMIAFRFIGVNSFVVACGLCIIYSVGNTCYWQLMPSMIYDVCEVEELSSGKKHSGAVISLQALAESVSIAIGLQFLGIILEQAGFQSEAAVQSVTACTWVSNCFTLLPGIFMLLVVFIINKYPIDKKHFDKVMNAVEKQRDGETPDLDEFDDIF